MIYLMGLASGMAGLLLYGVSAGLALVIGIQLACWWMAIAGIEYARYYRSKRPD
jgi:hypothetical protein